MAGRRRLLCVPVKFSLALSKRCADRLCVQSWIHRVIRRAVRVLCCRQIQVFLRGRLLLVLSERVNVRDRQYICDFVHM